MEFLVCFFLGYVIFVRFRSRESGCYHRGASERPINSLVCSRRESSRGGWGIVRSKNSRPGHGKHDLMMISVEKGTAPIVFFGTCCVS